MTGVLDADLSAMSVRSWLFEDIDNARCLDMEMRLRPIRRRTFAVLALGLVLCVPWVGWWPLVAMAGAAGVYWVAEQLLPRVQSPPTVFFATYLIVEAITAVSVALTGRLRESVVCLLAIPAMTLNARFSTRGIAVCGLLAALAMAAVLLGGDARAIVAEPPLLVAPVMLIVAWVMLSTPLMRSDIEHRQGMRIDPLTGMLNRNALAGRVEDLSEQSRINGGTVGVIHGDIDHFKSVNDTHGHAAGDAVLKDIAYALRKHVRAFESVYRSGGEEFLILLPGADLQQAAKQAERLRRAIEHATFGDGHTVTMSFGVAASREGEIFDFPTVFGEADQALYDAKKAGRNRVQTTGSTSTPKRPGQPLHVPTVAYPSPRPYAWESM